MSFIDATRRGNLKEVQYYVVCNNAHLDEKEFEQSLITATMHNHLHLIKYLLHTGAVIKEKILNKMLIIAAKHNYFTIVKYLVEVEKASLNEIDGDETAALGAAKYNHTHIVKYLGDHGALLNHRTANGRSALGYATMKGNFELVKYLTSKNSYHDTNLLIKTAIRLGYYEITVHFLTPLISGDAKNWFKQDFIELAAASGHLSIFQFIFNNHNSAALVSPLYTAAKNNHLEIVKFILECKPILAGKETVHSVLFSILEKKDFNNHGKLVKYYEHFGKVTQYLKNTLMAQSLAKTNLPIQSHITGKNPLDNYWKQLTDNNPDLKLLRITSDDMTDADLNKLCTILVHNTNLQVLVLSSRQFTKNGVKNFKPNRNTENIVITNEHNDKKSNSLQHGKFGLYDVGMNLAEKTIEAFREHLIGVTYQQALFVKIKGHMLFTSENRETYDSSRRQLLPPQVTGEEKIDHNLFVQNYEKRRWKSPTPSTLPKFSQHALEKEDLRLSGYELHAYLQSEMSNSEQINAIFTAIDTSTEIDKQDQTGRSPLLIAVVTGNLDVIRRIVDKGANIQATDNQGNTALMIAAAMGHEAVVKYFISKIDVNLQNKNGKKAYDFAKQLSDKENAARILNALATPKIASGITVSSSLENSAQQIQQSAFSEQSVIDKLLQMIQADARKLLLQTTKDYEAQIQKLKNDIEERKEKQKIQQLEIDDLKLKLQNVSGIDHQKMLLRIKQLEENQNILIQDYQEKETNLAQQEHILKCQEMARFYLTIQNKLQEFFLATKVIASGLVVNNALTTSDKAIKAISLAGSAVPLPGSQAVATWLGYAIQAGVYVAQKMSDNKNNNKIENITASAVSFAQLDHLIETTARRLTFTYNEQLGHITLDSVGILAESAVKLMIAYLWAGDYEKSPLHEQLVKSVARVQQEVKSKNLWDKIKEKTKELSNTFNDPKITTTKTNQSWTAFGVFQLAGIEVPEIPDSQFYSGAGTQPHIYGYRLGTMDEAVSAKMTRDANRLTAKSSTSSSTEQYLRNLAAADEQYRKQIDLLQTRTMVMTSGESSNQTSATKRPVLNKVQQLQPKEIIPGIYITGLRVDIDREQITGEHAATIFDLIHRASKKCKDDSVECNSDKEIIAMTLNANIFMEKFEKDLLSISKPAVRSESALKSK